MPVMAVLACHKQPLLAVLQASGKISSLNNWLGGLDKLSHLHGQVLGQRLPIPFTKPALSRRALLMLTV